MNSKPSKKIGRFRAALDAFLGKPIGLTSGEDVAFWREYGGMTSTAGQVVNENSVLRLSAVWACARLISETIATLPLSIYERTAAGKRVATDHPLQYVVHNAPNADSTASLYWQCVVLTTLLQGMSYSEKLVSNGKIIGLQFLAPNRLSILKLGNGRKEYRYSRDDGTQRVIPNDRIWALPGFSIDGKCGLSAIQYGVNVFGSAQAADTAAARTFQNGLLQTVYYKIERVLSPTQRNEFRDMLKEVTGAIHAGKSPVLEAGMSADTIGINPNDAQLLESRGFSVEEICRWFKVPPFMVGHAEKSTSWGTGIEQQMIGFLTFTLQPWLVGIEQAIWKDLLRPEERTRYYAKFAVEGLLRADSAARGQFYGVMVDHGILTRDEVRELEDRVAKGGNAGVLTVQSAMTTLDSIGATSDANQVRDSMRAFLGIEAPKEPKP